MADTDRMKCQSSISLWTCAQVKSAIVPVMVVAGGPKRTSVKGVSMLISLAEDTSYYILVASSHLVQFRISMMGQGCCFFI